MDGLHEMTAPPLSIEIEGNTYLLSPLTLNDEGEIEQAILRERRKPADVLEEMLDGLSEASQRKLLEVAFREEIRGPRVAYDDVVEWLGTKRGSLYRLWLMFRHCQPDMTPADVERLALAAGGLSREADDLSGKPLGNLSPPDNAGGSETGPASLGGQSSADCPPTPTT